jgi:hypothetical protein
MMRRDDISQFHISQWNLQVFRTGIPVDMCVHDQDLLERVKQLSRDDVSKEGTVGPY